MNQLAANLRTNESAHTYIACICCVSLKNSIINWFHIDISCSSLPSTLTLSLSLALHRKSVVIVNYAPQPKTHSRINDENSAMLSHFSFKQKTEPNEQTNESQCLHFSFIISKRYKLTHEKQKKKQYRKMNRQWLVGMVMMKNLRFRRQKTVKKIENETN